MRQCHVRSFFKMTSTCYGVGPWFVVLLVHEKTQQSQLFIHSYPELYKDACNFVAQQPLWTCRAMIGPFDSLHQCQKVHSDWGNNKQLKTRLEYATSTASHEYQTWIQNAPSVAPNQYTLKYPYITVADVKRIRKKK